MPRCRESSGSRAGDGAVGGGARVAVAASAASARRATARGEYVDRRWLSIHGVSGLCCSGLLAGLAPVAAMSGHTDTLTATPRLFNGLVTGQSMSTFVAKDIAGRILMWEESFARQRGTQQRTTL